MNKLRFSLSIQRYIICIILTNGWETRGIISTFEKMGSFGKFDRKLNPVIWEVVPCVQESTSRCSEYYSATSCRIVLVYIYIYIVGKLKPVGQSCACGRCLVETWITTGKQCADMLTHYSRLIASQVFIRDKYLGWGRACAWIFGAPLQLLYCNM
jgi:hypothetical protein